MSVRIFGMLNDRFLFLKIWHFGGSLGSYITTTPTRRLASHAVIFRQVLQTVTEVLFTTLRSCRQHCSDVSGVPYRNEECQNIKIWHSDDVTALL